MVTAVERGPPEGSKTAFNAVEPLTLGRGLLVDTPLNGELRFKVRAAARTLTPFCTPGDSNLGCGLTWGAARGPRNVAGTLHEKCIMKLLVGSYAPWMVMVC